MCLLPVLILTMLTSKREINIFRIPANAWQDDCLTNIHKLISGDLNSTLRPDRKHKPGYLLIWGKTKTAPFL